MRAAAPAVVVVVVVVVVVAAAAAVAAAAVTAATAATATATATAAAAAAAAYRSGHVHPCFLGTHEVQLIAHRYSRFLFFLTFFYCIRARMQNRIGVGRLPRPVFRPLFRARYYGFTVLMLAAHYGSLQLQQPTLLSCSLLL
ncbi:unnamed protein product [Gongylonema pulchrum]|uniref:Secreted protein n=1 Tax=Gongylonema pulchrum TaxID=637853 RepID=A0A183E540_9BILA|nr:unnamed protein product [Gongylonema pulchrum]